MRQISLEVKGMVARAREGKLGSVVDAAGACSCGDSPCYPQNARWCLDDEKGCERRLEEYLLGQR